MKPVFIFISLLIMLCPAFSQSRMEHYLDSLGLVNVAGWTDIENRFDVYPCRQFYRESPL